MLSYCEKPYEGELLYGFALRMYRYNEEPESFRRFAFRNFGIGYGTGRGTKSHTIMSRTWSEQRPKT